MKANIALISIYFINFSVLFSWKYSIRPNFNNIRRHSNVSFTHKSYENFQQKFTFRLFNSISTVDVNAVPDAKRKVDELLSKVNRYSLLCLPL